MSTEPRQIILAVDDEPLNIKIIGEKFKKDYEIHFATSGQECLTTAQSETPPDLILLDVVMPGMNGYEVCSRLKEIPKTREIPVIFITGLTETEDIVKGFRVGAVDFVTKPFRSEELVARVQTHMALKKAKDIQNDLIMKLKTIKEELELSLSNVKQLSGLLPICSNCKNIRDDRGYWQQVDHYIGDHSVVQFSHSLCPKCIKELYPDMADDILK